MNGQISIPRQILRVAREGRDPNHRRIREVTCDCLVVRRVVDTPLEREIRVVIDDLGTFVIAGSEDYLDQTDRSGEWIENRIKQLLKVKTQAQIDQER